MRRIVSAIAVLLVFFTLQYGKVAEYLYCAVQAKVVLQQAADCGCDQHLVGMFGDDGSDGFTNSPVKEKPSDLFTSFEISSSVVPETDFITSYLIKPSVLLNRSLDPAFHPPA